MKQIRPLWDRVTIKRDETKDTTEGGIIIPDRSKEKPQGGEVLAIGTKVEEVKIGDKVMFSKYAGTETEVEGASVILVREEDIMFVVEERE